MEFIIHEVMHLLSGVFFFLIVLMSNKNSSSSSLKIGFAFLLGGIGGILPDISKIMGDLLLHSLILLPIASIIFSILCFLTLGRNTSFFKIYIASILAIGSHLLIDYFGNGISLFYPLVKKEYSLNILMRVDWIWISIIIIGIFIMVFLKSYRYLFLSLLVIYTGLLIFSNIQLKTYLEEKYKSENIEYIYVFSSSSRLKWDFMIKTEFQSLHGNSNIISKKINILPTVKVD